jgi:hypothetical protein
MKRTSAVILILSVLLVGSNLFWLYQSINAGISDTYLNDQFEQEHDALQQVLKILPLVSASKPKSEIISAIERQSGTAAFEKEGFIWVGSVGLHFNEAGVLVAATTNP